ncbi:MAG: hypothetical protein U0105_14580 [Candidatus Obscuribacterales bacterium]|jgi:tetratricopeptide (TPR) repeat protein
MQHVSPTDIEKALVAASRQTAVDLERMAERAFANGSYHNAEVLLKKQIHALRDAEGVNLNSPLQAEATEALGTVLAKQANWKEAAQLWEEAYRRYEKVFSVEGLDDTSSEFSDTTFRRLETLERVARNLVLVYDALGDIHAAGTWRIQIDLLHLI